jgi:oxaloacetate decarboxylase alpha subunit
VRVREELGHPVSATPFSQLIGIQSVLNIVTGERWSVVPDEVIIYLMGKFGTPPAPVDENVRDKVLSSAHGQRFAGWERPQPSLSELREQYGGKRTSDEELLLRYMVPLEDLEAAYAAGPVKPTYDFRDPTTLHELLGHAMSLNRPRHVRIDRPELDLTLRRTSTSVS